ncbi:DUF4274 domain-containing protein [Elizabethkingia anophelis]|uniref:DUF4274 domain-containing protein n=1 Tax=Elizabethkingia anophelis TaxID=1117645 RepID=UPI000442BBD6|nr:DUF4274 domain-containing protein [Elizabethkingia anophelis]CDN76285.1 conserved hypothetical protein [Elizabethkingia anophelis]CDN80140.1 conserved hypothetical protein [Elizabethkingia anophelis]
MNITNQQQDFINTHFHEGIQQSELDESIFRALKTSEELHYLTTHHNWDNGVKVLQWIVESPICSEAIALELFWLAQPQDFQQCKLDITLQDEYLNEVFTLLKTILKNYPDNFYKKTSSQFDPAPFYENELIIPDWIYQKTNGEDSYVYYEEDDIEDWFDADWKNNIQRAESAIELFNIAWFMDEPEQASLILEHPLCDKGIAVLVFWRLYNECAMYTETNGKLKEIIHNILNNAYPDVLSYDPKTDEKVDYKKTKIVWEIPEIFRKPV